MDVHELVNQKVRMLKSGCGRDQIQREIIQWVFSKYGSLLTIDRMIGDCMEIYAECIKQVHACQASNS